MTHPVRLLRADEERLIAAACRAFGLDPGEDVRSVDACVQIRTRLVLERPSRAAASTALVVPGDDEAADGAAEAACGVAAALVREGARAGAVLPDSATGVPGAATARARIEGALERDVDPEELELLLALGMAPARGAGGSAGARALDPFLAVDADGNPALVGPGSSLLVGASLPGERVANRCVDWALLPCGVGPLGVHHAVELRGRRAGTRASAALIRSAGGTLSHDALQAIRAARLHGLDVAVLGAVELSPEVVASARGAGASGAFVGRSAPRAAAEWLRGVRAVGAGAACYLGAREMPWERRVRAVAEKVLGCTLASVPPCGSSAAELFFARSRGVGSQALVVAEQRWLGSVGINRVEFGPGSGSDG